MTSSEHPFLKLLGVCSYVMTLLYLIALFFPSNLLVITYSILGVILLLSSLFYISTVNRLVVLILVIVGSICFYLEEVSYSIALRGFGENTNLLSLFLLIPLIGTFMSTAGYLTALKEKVQERERVGKQHPYRLSYFLTAALGFLLNYGSIAIVKRISEESFSSYQDKKLTLNIMRAFGSCMLWSPYFVNVGLLLVMFDLSWFDLGGYGLVLGVLYIFISWLLFRKIDFLNESIVKHDYLESETTNRKSLVPLFTFSTVLIALSFILDFLLQVNMLTVVTSLSLVLPLAWASFTGILRSYIQDVSEQVQQSFIRLKNEFAVFISAGYFGMALSYTEIGSFLSSALYELSFGSVFFSSLLIVILTILLAQIGIHPVIILIGIGSSLSPAMFGVSPVYLALNLLIAWTTATQISPFSGMLLMAARLMDQPPSMIIKQNYLFSIILAGLLTAFIYFLHLLRWL
ncbi:hypothetical protein LCL95_04165 [Bacillus timonensis]|nr:hypothetical protein [Bacillus timonensis]